METRRRNATLDCIKGACIMFVIFTHIGFSGGTRARLLFPFWIDMAVPVFMIVSGYVGAASNERRGADSFPRLYEARQVLLKSLRLTVPFAAAYLIEVAWRFCKGRPLGINGMAALFIQGSTGPGSYYYPVMMQFIVVFPAIYLLILRYDCAGLALCLAANAAYELLARCYLVGDECYRLLVFRYMFVIAWGCWLRLSRGRRVRTVWKAASFAAGALFLVATAYAGYTPRVITRWTGTSFAACLYVLPLISPLVASARQPPRIFAPLALCGRASFNICLSQMVFFAHAAGFLYARIANVYLRVVIIEAACLCAGVLFYLVEAPVTRRLAAAVRRLPAAPGKVREAIRRGFLREEGAA